MKKHALESAVEVATMILRIDDVIASKKTSSSESPKSENNPSGMGSGGAPSF